MDKYYKLLSQLKENNQFYYLLNNRDLYTEDNIEFLCNDNLCTFINILTPTMIGGIIPINSESVKFYIDFIDGKGKPGTIGPYIMEKENAGRTNINIIKVINERGEKISEEQIFVKFDSDKLVPKENLSEEINIEIINNNCYIQNEQKFYVFYEKENSVKPNYYSLVKNENFEDSATISPDYPSGYSDSIYSKKLSAGLFFSYVKERTEINGNNEEHFIPEHGELTWIVDNNITENVGKVTFSIRIEVENGENDPIKWQSNTSSFLIKENLKEYYNLKAEIEENFIIQNREIKPVGDFSAILVKGDSNSNKLFYKMSRYFQGQDMLAPKKQDNYNIVKNKNDQNANIYYAEIGDKYYNLKTKYYINNIYFNYENKTYIWINGINSSVTIGDYTFKNFEIIKNQNKEYSLSYIYNNSNTITTINLGTSLNDSFILLAGEVQLEVTAVFNMKANEFIKEENVNTEISKADVVPVYNRIIRFVFSSPNKDYADYNIGEIEYVNNEEDYFIFSWTPNYQVTRSEGEVSYTIEFYINSIEYIVDANGNTIQPKSYSWSTLPSIIKVEDNEAATATVDYIPNWVSYVENYFQNDFNEFLNVDLKEQIDILKNQLFTNVGINLIESKGAFDSINDFEFTINEDKIYCTVEETNEENTYSFQQEGNQKITLKSISENNYIYTGIYNLLIGEDSIFACVYYNRVNNSCSIYYATSATSNEPLVPQVENRINDIITKFNKNVYNNPTNQSFEFSSEDNPITLETKIGNILEQNNQDNDLLRKNILDDINNLINLLNRSYNVQNNGPVLYNEDQNIILQSSSNEENIVNLGKNIFKWSFGYKENNNQVQLILECKKLLSYIQYSDSGQAGNQDIEQYYFDLGKNQISIKENSNKIILSTEDENIFQINNGTTNSIQINNQENFSTIYGEFYFEKIENENDFYYSITPIEIGSFYIPVTTEEDKNNEAYYQEIFGVKYWCYIYSIIDELNTRIVTQTASVTEDVENNVTNYLIGENPNALNIKDITTSSLLGQLISNIDNLLLPYTQGAEGSVYQTIFSNIANLTNIDDISNTYDIYVSEANNARQNVNHNYSNGVLTITI